LTRSCIKAKRIRTPLEDRRAPEKKKGEKKRKGEGESPGDLLGYMSFKKPRSSEISLKTYDRLYQKKNTKNKVV